MIFQKKSLITLVLPAIVFLLSSYTLANDKISAELTTKLETSNGETTPVLIYLTDKGGDISEKLEQFKASLTVQSLLRRQINRGIADAVSIVDVPVNDDYLAVIKNSVTQVRHVLKTINVVSAEANIDEINYLSTLEFVEKIEPVKVLKRRDETVETIDYSYPQAILTNEYSSNTNALDYGDSITQNEQINVPEVHALGYSGDGVVIAVFDSGFNRLSHESFDQIEIAGTYDFVNGDEEVGDQTDMGEGSHGTYTLSTIGGFSEGSLIGPAYGATYYLAKTENTEYELHVEEDNWCAAAEWAEQNGAQIITSSLGYGEFDSGTDYSSSSMDGDTTIVTQCADLIAENGIVIINSAGNQGSGETTIGAPSDGNYVVAVGAVTSTGERSSFSSVGPSADGRIKPDVAAMGSSVVVASSAYDYGYTQASGTSFSCPLTAGVAALVLEANPNLSAAQVRDILRNSGNASSTPDNLLGHGIVDAVSAVEAALAAESGNIAPEAAFAVVTDNTNAIATFTNYSEDSDGTLASYYWSFGDEQSSTEEHPVHSYNSSGSFTVSLTVVDDQGASETVAREIEVEIFENSGNDAVSTSGGASFYLLLASLLLLSRRNLIHFFKR